MFYGHSSPYPSYCNCGIQLLLVVLAVGLTLSKTQSAPTNPSGSALMQRAQEAYQASQFPKAARYYSEAARYFDSTGADKSFLNARYHQLDILQALSYKRVQQFDSVWQIFRERSQTYRSGNSIYPVRALYLKAKQYVNVYDNQDSTKRALTLVKRARQKLNALNESYPEDLTRIHITKSGVYKNLKGDRQDHPEKALALARQNPGMTPAVRAKAFFSYGSHLRSQQLRDSAIIYLRKGLNLLQDSLSKFHDRTFYYYWTIGKQHRWQQRATKAKKYYDTAYRVLKANNSLNTRQESIIQMEFGYHHMTVTRRKRKAFTHYARAVNILEQKEHNRKKIIRAHAYITLGNILAQLERYKEGIDYCERSLDMLKEDSVDGQVIPFKVQTYAVLAYIHSQNKAYNKAIDAQQKGLRILDQYPRSMPQFRSGLLKSLGGDYMQLGAYEKAKHYIRQSKPFYNQTVGKGKPIIGHKIYYNLANVNLKMGHYDSAFHYLHKASNYNTIGNSRPKPRATPSTATIIDNYYGFMGATLRARTFRNLYKDHHKVAHLQKALKQIEHADTLFQKVRQEVMVDKSSNQISGKTSIVYPNGVALCHLLRKRDSVSDEKKKRLFKKAYRYSEKNRAFALSGKMTKQDLITSGKIPDSLANRIHSCKSKITAYTDSIQMVTERSKKLAFKNKRLKHLQEKTNLFQTIKQRYPHLYNQQFKRNVAPLDQVKGRLEAQDKNLVQYVLGKNDFFAVILTPENHHMVALSESGGVEQQIEAFRDKLVDSTRQYDQEMAYQLYKQLFQPVAQHLTSNNVVIVPDGMVNYLPFDILLNRPSENGYYEQFPYLIRDYTFSYAPSATLWLTPEATASKAKKPKDQEKVAYTGFAPSFTGNNRDSTQLIAARGNDDTLRVSLAQIPGAKVELTHIADKWPGQKFMGRSATETRFKKEAPGSQIIHLATHGIINDQNPYYSRLMLASREDSGEDGALYNYEIYNLDLNAELAVLSACRTGHGKAIDGEGVMSLARGFKIAGCKNILMTQWAVEDQSTSTIVQHFYDNLSEGMEKSEALRQAKLTYLASSKSVMGHPFYWSGFVMMGSDVKLSKPDNQGLSSWAVAASGGLLIIIIPLAWFFWRMKKPGP